MQADRYSQTIALLKVILPLVALALLSTLFLISRAVTPTASVPFADSEVQEKLTNQQVSEPFFSGISASGDEISFIAERLNSPDGSVGSSTAEEVIVQVSTVDGRQITIEANTAVVDMINDQSEMTGEVEAITSDGFRINTNQLLMKLSKLDLISPGPLAAETPVGDLEAGYMRLFVPEGQTDAQLLFTGGVKLLYVPSEEDK